MENLKNLLIANADISIIILFVIFLTYASWTKIDSLDSIMHYSLGRRLFTTPELVFTILATWASGSGFFIDVTEFYFNGFQFLIPSLGMVVCLGLVSFSIVQEVKIYLVVYQVLLL